MIDNKLTLEQQTLIEKNKQTFLDLLKTAYDKITSANTRFFDYEGLVTFLINNGFFEAPASIKYHSAFDGGLCAHSLRVYHNLKKLINQFEISEVEAPEESIILTALFHDLSKINFYEKTMRNVKIYGPQGSKHDNGGKYDWFAEQGYKIKDTKELLHAGTHAYNSLFLLEHWVVLTDKEKIAILNHHANMDTNASSGMDIGGILTENTLALFLHMADMIAAFHNDGNQLSEIN